MLLESLNIPISALFFWYSLSATLYYQLILLTFTGNITNDIDNCQSVQYPCKNNGICLDYVGYYRCDCIDTGYKGENCDEGELYDYSITKLAP